MRVITLGSAGYASNAYLIVEDTSKTFAVVDPSCDPSAADELFRGGYTLSYVLLTHGHFDHILFTDEWRAKGGKVCIHTEDADKLGDPAKSLYLQFFARDTVHGDADVLLHGGDTLSLGEEKLTVLHTPGHTRGSVCYLFGDTMISGDTLFDGSVGRTDLPGSDPTAMRQTIEKLSALQTDYTIYPGHGGMTTLSHEKKFGYLHE